MEKGRETEIRGHTRKISLAGRCTVWDGNALHKARRQGFSYLTHTANCRQTSVLARGGYCSHNAPGKAPSSSFQNGCRRPPTKADKELGLKAQEPSLPSPQQVWPGQQSSPCSPPPPLPLSPGCRVPVPWGSGQSLCLGDKWLLQGLFHLAVGHGHYQPQGLLMRNAQDIHGRGHRSEWLALNYIFLTANYF